MKPEDKVPTREQCQKLVELGVVLETEKYWVQLRADKSWHLTRFVPGTSYDDRIFDYSNRIPAPDVAELGELLPMYCLDTGPEPVYLEMAYFKGISGKWYWGYEQNDFPNKGDYFESGPFPTEAQVRAAALAWLTENGYRVNLTKEER